MTVERIKSKTALRKKQHLTCTLHANSVMLRASSFTSGANNRIVPPTQSAEIEER